MTGEEADPEVEPPPVVSLSVVSQPGLPRRQVYYPYIAWRLSRVLQVHLLQLLALEYCSRVMSLCTWAPVWLLFLPNAPIYPTENAKLPACLQRR